ncbi:putative Type I restriction enzyme StySPI M protein [Cocos nucifera]|uniref:Putative Type I restriction enzyme StySPI M protein n=1 Tax=Cocos nucifera TaxID=13894 RepID=A0A8K0IG12_COCNU|nr:putative Type I restriction enzyme StySPI M protein [Cocos nucifera]
MKLLSLAFVLALLMSATVAVESSNEDLYHRKIKFAVKEGLKHHQLEDMTATIRHHLLQNLNGGRSLGSNEPALDATSSGEDINSTVDEEGNPFDATGNGNKSEYRGAGTDSHHSIDLESWNKMHPPKPDN